MSPTFPGVNLPDTESIPHGVTAATTNLTAFIGEFPRGPIDRAVLVTTWGAFTTEFGDLTASSSLAAYAVWHFFLNGGVGAWIVRVAPSDASEASAELTPAGLTAPLRIGASSVGSWGKTLQIAFSDSASSNEPGKRVDLTVTTIPSSGEPTPAPLEVIRNIPTTDDAGSPLPDAEVAAFITAAASYVRGDPVTTGGAGGDSAPTFTPLTDGGSDGTAFTPSAFATAVRSELQQGARLDQIAPQTFNIMCIPDLATAITDPADPDTLTFAAAYEFCERRKAFLIIDPPPPAVVSNVGEPGGTGLSSLTTWAENFLSPEHYAGATYYPWVQVTDPPTGQERSLPPSGAVAGIYATTDTNRGVWKAPAGVDAVLEGVTGLADLTINDEVNGDLNVRGINCLRTFPIYGSVVWGGRTLAGSDLEGSPFKYVPVRRLADYIELSVKQSLRWAVFEPNDAPLWASITVEVTAFMTGLFGAGAFAGATPADAYTVQCNATTTSPTDILSGVVNVHIDFAAVDPAEFVMLNIQIDAAPAGTRAAQPS